MTVTLTANKYGENITLRDANYLYHNLGSGITYLTLMSIFSVFGTFGNILVICAVLTNKRLKIAGNIFIVNLALADLCVSAFVDPLAIVGFIKGEEYFLTKPALCETIASICLTSCFCSLLSIAAISFNRYIHICHSTVYGVVFTWRKTLLITFILWIVSFLLEMSCFIGWGDHVYDRKTMSCVYDRTADFSYTIFFCSVGVGAPLLTIFACYVGIFTYVWKSKRKIRHNRRSNKKGVKPSDLKFIKTILFIVILFVACWVPYVTVTLYDRDDLLPPSVHTYVVMAAHMSSSMNFVLYGVTNRHFREGYLRILKWNRTIDDPFIISTCKRIPRCRTLNVHDISAYQLSSVQALLEDEAISKV